MKTLVHKGPATRVAPLLVALLLAGCMGAPQAPVAADAGLTVPARFAHDPQARAWTTAEPAESQPRGDWWLGFADPVLTALVVQAGEGNTGLQEAAARLDQARALLRTADARRAPQLGVGAGAARQAGWTSTGSAQAATVLSGGLQLSYELDVLGRLSQASDAARLDAQQRQALLQSARLLVQAEVAQTYLRWRAVQAEYTLVAESLAAYSETLRLTQRRLQVGDVAELEVARLQTEMAATEAEALSLLQQQAQLLHALAVLVGEVASGFALPAAGAEPALPAVAADVPASVLARRPDVAAAQAGVMAAQARVGVAQKAWFPAITLTGQGGYASPDLGDLFKWSARSWGIGALLSLPLLDGGQRQAQEDGARAQLDAAMAVHRGQVLAAFRDVEDQLSALHWLHAQSQAQSRAVASARRATQLSESRYRNGMVSQLELLDARRSELRSLRQALQVRTAQYLATVGVIRALGGGWDVAPT